MRASSQSFDRVASLYDRTRVTDGAVLEAAVDLLDSQLPTGRLLEIGVGTGALAVPLVARGRQVVGIDVAYGMLEQLRAKEGGQDPGLVLGDATRLPFGDGSFAGAYCRWVLHLIREWRTAVAELCRVTGAGSVIIVEPGGYGTSGWREVYLRFIDILGEDAAPVGLDLRNQAYDLDEALSSHGASFRQELRTPGVADGTLGRFFRQAAERTFSWTWRVAEADLLDAIDEVRAWAPGRFGVSLDEPFGNDAPHRWRVYDLL
jgi:ubiquinone/menaquinone biosynthesis C-methylase UbiE